MKLRKSRLRVSKTMDKCTLDKKNRKWTSDKYNYGKVDPGQAYL